MEKDLTIPISELGNTTNPLATPPAQTSNTSFLNDISSFLKLPEPTTTIQGQNVSDLQTNNTFLTGEIAKLLGDTSTQGERTLQAEKDAGIPQLQTDLTDIVNEINTKDLEFRRIREEIMNTPGLTVGQRNARLADVTRKQTSELADLEVIRMARSNSLENAQSIIDRKLQLEFADEQARIDGLKFFYNENKELLTKADDREYQKLITQEERAFEIAKSNYQAVEQAKVELVKNASINGASPSTLKSIMSAKTLDEAYTNAGSYGLSLADQYTRNQIRKQISDLGVEVSDSKIEQTVNNVSLVDRILNSKGITLGVGTAPLLRAPRLDRAQTGILAADVKQLVGNLTLSKLQEAKANGVTFGALSEQELQTIANSATTLSSYMRTTKSGVTYFNTTEKEFKAEINRIRDLFIADYERSTGLTYPSINNESDYAQSIISNYSPFSTLGQ